jgi:hypothetical protein
VIQVRRFTFSSRFDRQHLSMIVMLGNVQTGTYYIEPCDVILSSLPLGERFFSNDEVSRRCQLKYKKETQSFVLSRGNYITFGRPFGYETQEVRCSPSGVKCHESPPRSRLAVDDVASENLHQRRDTPRDMRPTNSLQPNHSARKGTIRKSSRAVAKVSSSCAD